MLGQQLTITVAKAAFRSGPRTCCLTVEANYRTTLQETAAQTSATKCRRTIRALADGIDGKQKKGSSADRSRRHPWRENTMSCSKCGQAATEGAACCQACGSQLATAAASGSQASNPSLAFSAPLFRFDAQRLSGSNQIVGVAAVVLFVSLFMPWFGASLGYAGITVSVDGLWHGYMYITLFAALAILSYLIAGLGLDVLPFRLQPGASEFLLAGIAALNLLLVIISFVSRPILTSWQFGAYVGLIAAIAAVAAPGASAIISAQRARQPAPDPTEAEERS
jgi:hypothetical protein